MNGVQVELREVLWHARQEEATHIAWSAAGAGVAQVLVLTYARRIRSYKR